MERLVYFAQLAPRRAAPLRARAPCRTRLSYGTSCHKHMLVDRISLRSVYRPVYLSSCPWYPLQRGRFAHACHTEAGKGGESVWRPRCDGGERDTKDKFENGVKIRSLHSVRKHSEGCTTDRDRVVAAGKGGNIRSSSAFSTGHENKVARAFCSTATARVENTGSSDATGSYRLDAVEQGRQAMFDQPETGALGQNEETGERNDGFPANRGDTDFHIEVEMTPNPLARKFLVHGSPLLPRDVDSFTSKSFSKRDKYDHIPLIKSLFEIADITSVLVAKEYITVVKKKTDAWEDLEAKVRMCLHRHLKAGDYPLAGVTLSSRVGTPEPSVSAQRPDSPQGRSATKKVASESGGGSVGSCEGDTPATITDTDSARDDSNPEKNEDDEDVEEAIKSLLYVRARPMLLADGGDLEVVRFDADTGVVWVHLKGSCQGCPSSLITVKRGMKQMLQYYIPEVEDVRQCDENGEPLEEEDDD